MSRASFALLTAAIAIPFAACNTPMRGRPAPEFKSAMWVTPPGARTPRANTSGWRLLAFFDPDSTTSHADVPRLVQLQAVYGALGLEVIGITGSTRAAAEAFLAETGASYSILAHAKSDLASFGIHQIPVTLLVDADGTIIEDDPERINECLAREFGG